MRLPSFIARSFVFSAGVAAAIPALGGSAAPTPVGPTLALSETGSVPGAVAIAATLFSGGAEIAGTQNDLLFDPQCASIVAKTNGRPDCTVNADLDKTATSFTFRPGGCTDTGCTSIRALVLSTENTDPIPDGSVLYTCNVRLAGDGPCTVAFTGVIFSSPQGTRVEARGSSLFIVGTPGPLPSATPTATQRRSVPPTPVGPAITLRESGSSNNGELFIEMQLISKDTEVAGTQNDLRFDPQCVSIVRKADGRPDCLVAPNIDKSATLFAFRPPHCDGTACTSVRALVLSTDNTDAIPDSSVLYTCRAQLAGNGPCTIAVEGVILSSPFGTRVDGVAMSLPIIVGTPGPLPFATDTPPSSPTPTLRPPGAESRTPTFFPTATLPLGTRTATPTFIAGAALTPTPKVGGNDMSNSNGCSIVGPRGQTTPQWVLVLPLIVGRTIKRWRKTK